MPADHPLQKQYTAGSCRLNVELHPSAISQWYPQPVVQNLHFKLWLLASAANTAEIEGSEITEMQLIAEGDRAALQEISQYILQQVQSRLVIAQVNQRSAMGPRSTLRDCPAYLKLPEPLSYLTLCDLSSVLHQYEKTTALLPIAEPSFTSEPRLTNVVPITSARRRPLLWASSAAAAVFAIGLTTSLWTQPQPSLSPASSELADLDQDSRQTESNDLADNPTADSLGGEPTGSSPAGSSPAGSSSAGSSPADNGEIARSSTPDLSRTERRRSETAVPNVSQPSAALEPESSQSKRPSSETSRASLPNADESSPSPTNTPSISAAPPAPAAAQSEINSEPQRLSGGPSENRATAETEALTEAPAADTAPETVRRANPSRIGNQTGNPENMAPATITAQPQLNTVNQVQRYFQSKWQAQGADLLEPISYEIQISTNGDVVSFSALNDAAQQYRDRLFPTDVQFTLEPSAPYRTTGLSLRLNILPNGQVTVFEN